MRRYSWLVILSLLATAVPVAGLSGAAAATQTAGKTLFYKKTFEGQVTKVVVARTEHGQVAIYGYPESTGYAQYDGRRVWLCEVGKKCRITARGSKAKKGGEFLEDNFFDPYGKYAVAAAFMSDPQPSGKKRVAGVLSGCKSSPSTLDAETIITLCVSQREGFLTLLEEGEETYALQRTSDHVRASFLKVPAGVWSGKIQG